MSNPIECVIVGQALNTGGFLGNETVEGLGLNTRGFLWPLDGIWSSNEQSITTTWTDCSNCTDGC